MVDIEYVRQHPEEMRQNLLDRGMDPSLLDKVLKLDSQRRLLLQQVEELRRRRNQSSPDQAEEGRKIKKELKEIEPQLKETEERYRDAIYKLPNFTASDVPVGKDESENVVIRTWGEPKKFSFSPKDHVELGEILGVINTKKAAEVSGPRFGYLKGGAALLEFALIQYAMKILTSDSILKGYNPKPFIPVIPPQMIKPEVFVKMARLSPETEEERYYLPKDDVYLIGSAEHTLGALHMDETISEKDLPIRYVGFSTSFRREAGSYGQDTKGILRVHQFDKIEMESFTLPEDSLKEQEFFVALQEHFMQGLDLPYQVVQICTGDLGLPDYRQIDINCWLPGQGKYRETHTSDLMTDYQARRLNTKVKRKNGQTEYVHMNDATAFAIGRTVIAILENYQLEDGSVKIPAVLQPYVGKDVISPPKAE